MTPPSGHQSKHRERAVCGDVVVNARLGDSAPRRVTALRCNNRGARRSGGFCLRTHTGSGLLDRQLSIPGSGSAPIIITCGELLTTRPPAGAGAAPNRPIQASVPSGTRPFVMSITKSELMNQK
jgi:hypothetical protein